jgi:hypothetical protein
MPSSPAVKLLLAWLAFLILTAVTTVIALPVSLALEAARRYRLWRLRRQLRRHYKP